MSTTRTVHDALDRSIRLVLEHNIHNDIHKRFEFRRKTIFSDEILTVNEKNEAVRLLNKDYDRDRIFYNNGTKRSCEYCNRECLATSYCELCVRNYLKANFSNWTSGNRDIDNLIQHCQMNTLTPYMIIEWIPFNKLRNIEYLTKGGCSEIYTADWIDGRYFEWDSKEQQLNRFGMQKVAIKILENDENTNNIWFGEVRILNMF